MKPTHRVSNVLAGTTVVWLLGACSEDPSGVSPDAAGGHAGGGGHAAVPDAGPTPFAADTLAEVALTLQPTDWSALKADPSAETVYLAGVDWAGIPLTDVALSVRGSGSVLDLAAAGSDRFSFKLDLNDTLAEQTLYGEKKLYLNHSYKDPTHLREVLAYEVAATLGVAAPRAALVHVSLNGGSLGIYTVVEAVDGGFLNDRFPDPDGNLYQLDEPAGMLSPATDSPPSYEGLEVERGELGAPAPEDFLALVALLAMPGASQFEAVLDVDATLRYLAAQVALVNLDSYPGSASNYFLYAQSGVFTPIPWNVGGAFGLSTCGCPARTLLEFPIDAPTCGPLAERPLVAALLAVPDLRARYHTHLTQAADALESLSARVGVLAARIRPLVTEDTGTFFSAADFEWTLEKDLPRVDEPDKAPIFGLAHFLAARVESLRAQLAAAAPPAVDAAGACP